MSRPASKVQQREILGISLGRQPKHLFIYKKRTREQGRNSEEHQARCEPKRGWPQQVSWVRKFGRFQTGMHPSVCQKWRHLWAHVMKPSWKAFRFDKNKLTGEIQWARHQPNGLEKWHKGPSWREYQRAPAKFRPDAPPSLSPNPECSALCPCI